MGFGEAVIQAVVDAGEDSELAGPTTDGASAGRLQLAKTSAPAKAAETKGISDFMRPCCGVQNAITGE
jgi:hypothetical protein